MRELTVEAKKLIDAQGEAGRRMAFCPGSAQTNTGSPIELYDAAKRRAELMEEVEELSSALPIVY